MRLLAGILFLLLIGGIAWVVVESGRDFAVGMLFGIGVYQIAFYLNKGEFME